MARGFQKNLARMLALGKAGERALASFSALTREPARKRPAPPGAGRFLAGTHQEEAGERPYRLYIPPAQPAGAPLLVMLHGCTQSAEDFALGTRMNQLADAHGFLVLYPEQISSANAQRCWNWFLSAEQQRDRGEPCVLAGMTRALIAQHQINPHSVFVAGLSAGGAQAAILAARYPDIFARLGVHSGLACGAASTMQSALGAMRHGHAGSGTYQVPTIIFQGDSDRIVHKTNADMLAAQFAPGLPEETQSGQVPGGLRYRVTRQRDKSGRAMLERWDIEGMGHGWSGGNAAASFTEPAGPDASGAMVRFFLG